MQNNLQEPIHKEVDDTALLQATLDVLEQLETVIARWKETCGSYSKNISETNLALSDEFHYIEFTRLNCAEGFLAYKRLHEMFNEKRKMKNDFLVSSAALEVFTPEIECAVINIKKKIHAVKNRRYKPKTHWPE